MDTTNSIIEQIHHEASTAEQALLKEADRILKQASNTETVGRVKELQALGFQNFKEAVELSPEEVARVKKLQELIGLYRIQAPTCKFMTDEAVKELCEKYGLVQAPVGIYIDRIPERNQKEILDFKIDSQFLRNSFMETVEVATFQTNRNGKKQTYNFAKALGKKKDKRIGKRALEAIAFIVTNWNDVNERTGRRTERRTGLVSSESGTMQEITRKYSNIALSALKVALAHEAITVEQMTPGALAYDSTIFEQFGNHPIIFDAVGRLKEGMKSEQMELRIIAPKHMLKLEGYEINEYCQAIPEGYEMTSPNVKHWFEQDDPIVQAKVEGGWLNITAWGAEAEHPESFNEQLN